MPIVHMASKREEIPADAVNVRNVTEQWKSHSTDPGFELWLYESHNGFCIRDYERNGYDDSDFYMVVWNPATKQPQHICFGSTRGWSYPTLSSHADATQEVQEAYAAWKAAVAVENRKAAVAAEARLPKVNRTVRVIKGRKLPVGTLGVVFWNGSDRFASRWSRRSEYQRIGIRLENGEKVFLSGENVEVVL